MCGISGFIGKEKYFPNKKRINECINLMKRRGPDNQSFKKFEKNKLFAMFFKIINN